MFYAIDEDHSLLGTFDLSTGVWADLGMVHETVHSESQRVKNLEAMAYDWHTGQLLAVSNSSGSGSANLFAINPTTAEALLIGGVGFGDIRGLSYDPLTDMLLATRKADGDRTEFLSIDPATGAGTSLGTLDLGHVEALARDPLNGTLYGSVADRKRLVTVDLGALSYFEFNKHDYKKVEALGFDESGRLFGVDDNGLVLEFNTADGSALALTDTRATGDLDAMTFVYTSTVPEPAALLVCLFGGLLTLARKRWMRIRHG
jgi:hypothetical protein